MKRTIKPAIQVRAARWATAALTAMVVAGAGTAVGAPAGGSAAKGSVAAGKALYAKDNCAVCHKIGSSGGKMGPDLSKEGTKHDAQWLVALLKNPKSKNPKSKMPPVKGSPKQLQDLAAYLLTLK